MPGFNTPLPLNPFTDRDEKRFFGPQPGLIHRIQAVLAALTQEYQKGFDISQWNTIEDFKKARAAGYSFANIRVSDGLVADTKFSQWFPILIDAGFLVGFTHLFRSNIDGANQANFFLDLVAQARVLGEGRILLPNMDLETVDGTTTLRRLDRMWDWTEFIKKEFRTPAIYSSHWYWSELTGGATLGELYGWLAQWSSNYVLRLPPGWLAAMVKFLQIGVFPVYDWVPAVPGILKSVDVDLFLGSAVELSDIAGAEPPPPPEPEDDMATKQEVIDQLTAVKVSIDDIIEDVKTLSDGAPTPTPTPKPDPDTTWIMTVKADQTKAFCYQVWNEKNGELVPKVDGAGKPIMQDYYNQKGKRIVFTNGTQVRTYKDVTVATGGVLYHRIYNQTGDRGQKLYLLKTHMMKPG